jgi:hypothetical protein
VAGVHRCVEMQIERRHTVNSRERGGSGEVQPGISWGGITSKRFSTSQALIHDAPLLLNQPTAQALPRICNVYKMSQAHAQRPAWSSSRIQIKSRVCGVRCARTGIPQARSQARHRVWTFPSSPHGVDHSAHQVTPENFSPCRCLSQGMFQVRRVHHIPNLEASP